MVWLRLLVRSFRTCCRVSSSASPSGPPRGGLKNLRGNQFHNYSGSKLPRDKNRLSLVDEPHSRSWMYYAIPSAMLTIAGAGMWIHYNDERRATLKGSNQITVSERNTRVRWAYGGQFRLVNTDDHVVTEADLQGNWILMYFGYTSSPDVGPDEVKKMAEVIDILESQHNLKITPVFVSIDPQRDSPSQIRAYLREFHPKILGLTGPITAVRQIAQEYRVFFKKVEEEGQDYLVDSSNDMILLDPNMEIAGRFGVQYDAMQLSDSIMAEMIKASK